MIGPVRRPRLLILAVHPGSVAATRLRALQYVPALEAAGIDVRLWTFFDESGRRAFFGPSTVRRAIAVLVGMLRVPSALLAIRHADVVLVQREAAPLGPPVIERIAARRARLVWDVDDSVWVEYVSPTAGRVPRWLRAPGDKFAVVCRLADEVWAGSEVLAEWCRHHSADVVVVPTVVAGADVPPAKARTVGWIGSHSTGPFLDEVVPAVARVDPAPRLIVVGAEIAPREGVDLDQCAWSEAAEARALREIRVGLYPIDRSHPLAEGKCGLKAVLFMAHGIPVVVTPTTTNALVVRDGVEGLHASTPDEWTAAVQRLLDDEELWARCSAAARTRARRDFSLERWAPEVVQRVVRLAGDQRR
jgi:glycosyltransferase involved in cell wall biosynthesis